MTEQRKSKQAKFEKNDFLYKPAKEQNLQDFDNQMQGLKNNPDANAEQLAGAIEALKRLKSDCGLDIGCK